MLQRPTAIRSRLTAGSVQTTFIVGMRPFTRWLEQQEISRLCDADDAVLKSYADLCCCAIHNSGKKGSTVVGCHPDVAAGPVPARRRPDRAAAMGTLRDP